jgi:transcription elongation factor/antiterminator RfaH
MDAGWFVVQTKPRQEDTAFANLQQQGYTAYLPRLAVPRRRREQWVTVSEPLFPGYVFVQLTPGKDDPAPIRSTLGARGLVRFGQYTPQVDDTLIAFFREHEHAQQAEQPASTPFQPGNPVTILKGPFAGLPLMDMAAIMIRRYRKRQSMLLPDRDHLHHIFMRAGFSDRQALVIITLVAVVLAGAGLAGEFLQVPEWVMCVGILLVFAAYNVALSHVWRLTGFLRRSVPS